MNDKSAYSTPPVGNKFRLSVLIWGAVTFVVTFGGFWLLDTGRVSFKLGAMLFPNTDVELRYNYITTMLLSVPPIIIATIGGLIHNSWRVSVRIALVYALPVGTFFAQVIPAWH